MTVGSGEGLLCGGGGLSGSSISSRGSSLMCTVGSAGPLLEQETDAGRGIEMDDDDDDAGGRRLHACHGICRGCGRADGRQNRTEGVRGMRGEG